MTATRQQNFVQRSAAFALAVVVTLTLLVSIDALATQGARADALLAQRASANLANS